MPRHMQGLCQAGATGACTPPCTPQHALCGQVGDVERVFGLLRSDVEALFMTAHSVSLDALHADLQAAGAALQEQVRLFFEYPGCIATLVVPWDGFLLQSPAAVPSTEVPMGCHGARGKLC